MTREPSVQAKRPGRAVALRTLVLGLATALTALASLGLAAAGASAAAPGIGTSPDAAPSPDESAFVARALAIDERATVTPRPGEPRPADATRAPGAFDRGLRADRGVLAIVARACDGMDAGGIARWCLAHATATQAP